MTKKQLQSQIEAKDRQINLYKEIITKFTHDFVQIKPIPKGKVKQRIAIFIEPVVVNRIECETLMFLHSIEIKKEATLNLIDSQNTK